MHPGQLPHPSPELQKTLRKNQLHLQETPPGHLQLHPHHQTQPRPQPDLRTRATTRTPATHHLIDHNQLPTPTNAVPTTTTAVPNVRALLIKVLSEPTSGQFSIGT